MSLLMGGKTVSKHMGGKTVSLHMGGKTVLLLWVVKLCY